MTIRPIPLRWSPSPASVGSSSHEEAQGPVNVADKLRLDELRALKVLRDDGLVEQALKQLNERGGAQELVRQQYSGRYPFELLQNANDAARETGAADGRKAYFHLTDSALLVADNGAGFGEKQVKSICSLGASSKGPGQAIGHKGLGFKSVGEITDRPQIISLGVAFQFDGGRVFREVMAVLGALPSGQKLPVYAFPFALEDVDLGDDAAEIRQLLASGYSTVIRLPFRPDVDRTKVEADLANHLQSDLLLFLPSISELELRGTASDFIATILHERAGAAWKALLDVNGEQEQWLIYRHTFAPDPDLLEPLGEGWARVDELHISVAVFCDDQGQPRADHVFPLNVYFPTEESAGLPVNVHAEWILTLDRKHMSNAPEAEPVNAAVRDALARFVELTVATDLVARSDATSDSVHALVPVYNDQQAVTPGFGAATRQAWIDALARAEFIPAADGKLRTPKEVRNLPEKISNPFEAHHFARLSKKTIRPDLEDNPDLRHLIAESSPEATLGFRQFVKRLRTPDAEDLARYYAFLMQCATSAGEAFTRQLAESTCIATSHSGWAAPAKEPIFLPRGRNEAGVPGDIPVPIAVIPQDSQGVEGFLERLGVRPFQWRTIIEDFLMPILRDNEADEDRRTHALESLRAYREQRRGDETLTVLRDVLLPARSVNGTRALARSGDLYFGAEWTGTTDIEALYGPFGKEEFLDITPPSNADAFANDLGFYAMLGVLDRPRVNSLGRSVDFRWENPHPGDSVYQDWLRSPDVAEAASGCPGGHPESQRLTQSHQLDRLDQILESEDPERLSALWRQLAAHWNDYAPAMEALFHCQASASHPNGRDRTSPSLLNYTLQTRPWVPVVRGTEPELSLPAHAWFDAPDVPRSIRMRIPRIPVTMLDGPGHALARELGLTDAARPGPDDLLAFLGYLASDADSGGEVGRELTHAAKWVQRRLNDQLHPEGSPHPNPESIRLLATTHGRRVFAPQPVYTGDPLLRDAWAELEPVLEVEGRPHGLVQYLALDTLDDTVRTEPRPDGIHHAGSEADAAVRGMIEKRKAEVLALIAADVQSVEESAASRLRTLEVVVCEELALLYVGRGTEIPRADAPCYISVRREEKGRRRRIGTAYVRLLPDDSRHRPDWHAFAAQLATFLDAPLLADAFATVFTASPENRRSMLAQHSVELADVEAARSQLRQADLDGDDLDSLTAALNPENSLAQAAARTYAGEGTSKQSPLAEQGHPTMDAPASAPDEVTEDRLAPEEEPSENPAPPPVDHDRVAVVEANPSAITNVRTPAAAPHRPGTRASKAPSRQTEHLKREVGARGESVAFEAERRRIRALGRNPDLVDWVSRRDELAPYDFTSVDADGQKIFIEVKATTGADPGEPFQISRGELVQAALHRDRFYVYRVTNTYTEAPVVTRFPDPFGLVTDGKGELLLSKASMTLFDEGVASVTMDAEPEEN